MQVGGNQRHTWSGPQICSEFAAHRLPQCSFWNFNEMFYTYNEKHITYIYIIKKERNSICTCATQLKKRCVSNKANASCVPFFSLFLSSLSLPPNHSVITVSCLTILLHMHASVHSVLLQVFRVYRVSSILLFLTQHYFPEMYPR